MRATTKTKIVYLIPIVCLFLNIFLSPTSSLFMFFKLIVFLSSAYISLDLYRGLPAVPLSHFFPFLVILFLYNPFFTPNLNNIIWAILNIASMFVYYFRFKILHGIYEDIGA
jgi:hypothetical protein